jgi:hypothetical protein
LSKRTGSNSTTQLFLDGCVQGGRQTATSPVSMCMLYTIFNFQVPYTDRFGRKSPYPASLRFGPQTHFVPQSLPSSVPAIDMSASCAVLGLLSRPHNARIRQRLGIVSHKGRVRAVRREFAVQHVPETTSNRPGQDRRVGRSDMQDRCVGRTHDKGCRPLPTMKAAIINCQKGLIYA